MKYFNTCYIILIVCTGLFINGCTLSVDIAKRQHLPGYYINISTDHHTSNTIHDQFQAKVKKNQETVRRIDPITRLLSSEQTIYSKAIKIKRQEINTIKLTRIIDSENYDFSLLAPQAGSILQFVSPGSPRSSGNMSRSATGWLIIGGLALFVGLIMRFGRFGVTWTPIWGAALMIFGAAILFIMLVSGALD